MMSPAKPSHTQKAMLALIEQMVWIETHGASEAGYVRLYGDYGDGGEAIYDADVTELQRLYQEYRFAIA